MRSQAQNSLETLKLYLPPLLDLSGGLFLHRNIKILEPTENLIFVFLEVYTTTKQAIYARFSTRY